MEWQNRADAVVIGGGMMGMCTAYYLAKLGMKNVVVVEKNTVASGATGRCGAAFRAQWGSRLNIEMGKRCIDKFEHMQEETGMDIGLYQNGYLMVGYTEKEVEIFRQSVALQNSMGVPSRMISHDEAREICPGINVDDVLGFSYYERDGQADPFLCNFAYREAATRLGVKVQKFTEVIGVKVDCGQVKGVITNRGEIDAPIVVSAAGAWNRHIGDMAGVDFPVVGERHEALITEAVDFDVCPTMLMSFAGDYYIQQRPNGTIIAGCGPSAYPNPEHNPENMGNSWGFLERTAQTLLHVLPRTKDSGITHEWSGMYDLTPDLQSCIGETDEVKGLWLNVSGARGFMFGPVAGELVAQMILHGESELDISEFHWRRYAEGKKFKDLMVV